MVGLDGSHASEASLSWLRGFEASRACDLSLVRLYWPAEEALRYGLDDPWGASPRGPELAKLVERDVTRDAAAALGRKPSNLRLRIASNDAAEALAEEAAVLAVDGVVVGIPRHRSGRWAVLNPAAVLRAASLPVLLCSWSRPIRRIERCREWAQSCSRRISRIPPALPSDKATAS